MTLEKLITLDKFLVLTHISGHSQFSAEVESQLVMVYIGLQYKVNKNLQIVKTNKTTKEEHRVKL